MSSPPETRMGAMKLPVMPPVSPMLAKSVATIPPGASYEPKWDGFRSIWFRDTDEVELGSRNERPPRPRPTLMYLRPTRALSSYPVTHPSQTPRSAFDPNRSPLS